MVYIPLTSNVFLEHLNFLFKFFGGGSDLVGGVSLNS